MHTAHYFKEMVYDKLLPSNQPLSKMSVFIYPRPEEIMLQQFD